MKTLNTTNLTSGAAANLRCAPEWQQERALARANEIIAAHGLREINGAIMRQAIEDTTLVLELPAKPDGQWEAARVALAPKADCIEETLSFSINFSRGVIVANADIETARKIISDTGSTAISTAIPHRSLRVPRGMICEGETLIAIRYNGQQTIRTEVRGPADITNPNPRGTFGHAWITPIA